MRRRYPVGTTGATHRSRRNEAVASNSLSLVDHLHYSPLLSRPWPRSSTRTRKSLVTLFPRKWLRRVLSSRVTRGVLPTISTLEQTLDKIKSLYEVKFGHSFAEEAADKDGVEFTVTRGSPPSMSVLEQTLGEIKSMCKEKFGHSITDEVVERMASSSFSLM